MNKKIAGILSFSVAAIMTLSLVLTGCGNDSDTAGKATQQATTSEKSAEKVKLTYWHTYGDAEDPYFNSTILPLFQKKFPNIELEAVKQDNGQYNQLITTAFATNQTPDVARVDVNSVASYASLGGIINVDGFEGFKEIKDQCLEAPMATNLYKGKYYGLPLDTNCKAAVINMDFMKKLGFSEAPKTMEEIIDASKKASSGKYTITVSGVGDWDLYPYFWLFGGVLTDDQFTKATGYLDSPQSIAALQKIVDLHKDKVLTIRDIDGTPDAWNEILKPDAFAMFFEGPWFFSAKPEYKDKNVVAAPIPTYNGKSTSIVGGEDVVIFKNSKHQKEAFELVKFLMSEEVQMLMATQGQFPALKSAADKDQIKNNPIFSTYQKQLETAKLRIPSPQNTAINQHWSDEVTKALLGQTTAEAALKAAAAAIDEELSK